MDGWNIALMGLAAGVGGTGAGGFYIFLLKDVGTSRMSSILGFSGGVMLVAVFLELVPEALMISGLIYTMFGIIIGIIFLIISEHVIESLDPFYKNSEQYFAKTGFVLFLGIACHNFPEGLAIGSGSTASYSLGFILALTLAIHNVPEGLAVASAFRLSGLSNFKAFIYSAISGIPMGLGALAGKLLGEVSPLLIAVSMGFAAGAMIYITCEEILPDVFRVGNGSPWGFILGLMAGTVFFNIL